jgi:asparagine synthase (glutamine-hydrolysing)
MRHAEFYGMMQKTLRKVDLASMQNSVEVRVPFLQKNFIQASLQIDPLLNVSKKGKKEILKGLLYDKVPSITQLNDKKGFSVPLGQWMGKSLQSVFLELPEMITKSHECFDPRAVERLYSQHKKGLVDAKWPLFTLYALSRSIKSF